MKIERRKHPRGEAGTRISLDEAARRAAEGRLDPRTRAWAIEKIVQAGNPRGVVQRAAVILDALRRERIYIADPTDAEFIPSAACTLKGCDGLIFLGEDCDGLLVAFLAAVGSIGIEGAVVGHGYEDDGQLSHVLAAVFDGKQWFLSDPSTNHPFGQVDKPKRERWVGVPSIDVLCDSVNGACDPANIGSGLGRGRMRPQGDFVGVGSPRGGMVGTAASARTAPNWQAPSGIPSGIQGYACGACAAPYSGTVGDSAADDPVLRETLQYQVAALRQSIFNLRFNHNRLAVLRSEHMSRPIADVDPSPPEEGQWKLADEDYFQSLMSFSLKALEYTEQALAGDRPAGWDPDSKQIVIGGKPGEPVLKMDMQGNMSIQDMSGGNDAFVPAAYSGSGQLGIGLLAFGAIVIISYAVLASIYRVSDTVDKQIDASVKTDLGAIHQDMIDKGYTPEQADKSVQVISTSIADKAAALTKLEAEKGKSTSAIAETIQMVVLGAAGIAVIGVLAYGLITFTPQIKASLADRRERKRAERDMQAIETAGELVAIEA